MKNASNDTCLRSAGRQRDAADGQQHVLELRLLDVLEQRALGADLLGDAFIVGEVERGSLHRLVGVAGAEDDVDDADRRHAAQLRVAQLGVDGQVVLDVLQRPRQLRQLGGLGVVAHGDVGLERRLGAEPAVFVDLVRADGRLDAGVELHPRHVAVVIVVGQERGRPLVQERAQRRLLGGARRRAQQPGRQLQLALVFDAVGDRGSNAPVGVRRMVVKKPSASARAGGASVLSHASISGLVAPAG